jgi:ABC-type enterochelin transport system substrate-binding protein
MDLGNIQNCILDKVKEIQPNLIILGKRKSKFLDFIGDKVTQFVIDNCDTSVLICSSNREVHYFSDLSLGFFGEAIEKSDFQIINHLNESTRSVRYFGIRSKMSSLETNAASEKKILNPASFLKAKLKG